ncbi:MAG: UvrD-helicase domain-containing protein [Nocardioidaceae bacterium]
MTPLTDADSRERIQTDTAATLFVDAGAGSGKTRSLVDRVTTLVLADRVPLSEIAAVTFTEKAGAELRDRLRDAFESVFRAERQARREATVSPRLRERPAETQESDDGEREGGTLAQSRREKDAAGALDDLDGAAIGTLHSFAQRILTTHPIEAGLPPLVEVLDEVASSVAFDARWSVLQRELLDEESLAQAVRLALAAGVKLDHLRSLARAFQSDWDLIEDRVLSQGPPDAELPDVDDLVAEARAVAARGGECTDGGDRFLARLEALDDWVDQYTDATDPETQLAGLLAAKDLKWGYGQKDNWPGTLAEIKAAAKAWQERTETALGDFTEATLRPLAYWIATRVREAAQARAAEGRLEFHDLLVVARDLLRRDALVRAALQKQYRRLLLDEFQDTDPIQIEIAVRIAGGAAASAADWRAVDVPAGSIFVVGDPKQSIYRFRRADIKTYLRTQEWLGDDPVTLASNFRTVEPIVEWVNAVFETVITPVEDGQPEYVPLAATRSDPGIGPPVAVVGAEAHPDKPNAAEMREREAADVAGAIGQAIDEGWTTQDVRTGEWRPLRLGDIAILVPARTSLPFLEDALDAAGIGYRAESSSLVYQAAEVRDLLATARVIADPSDLLSCVTALRSPLFGCGDDDLWTWKRDGGSFNILARIPDERLAHPVADGLSYLRRLHDDARWMTPSEVLGAIVADRRMLEVAAAGPRARDQWRRLRFVVDQARAWSEAEHGGLRAYLAWAARQGEETARVAEAVLPESDVDAVRVMTVHAAKGLEFPMVVLSGMSSQPRNPGGVRLLWTPDGYAVKLTKLVQTNDFEHVAPIDEQMDSYERRRLLYVAATRARDHLVVSLHRKDGGGTTNADILAGAGAATDVVALAGVGVVGEVPAASSSTPAELPEWETWLASITEARERSRRASAISASGLEGTDPAVALDPAMASDAPGSAKGDRDIELPPWSKGRYGSAVGRAVHAVLQSIDLATGEGLGGAVTAQCAAEGVTEHFDIVRALVESALASEPVRRAATRPHWREPFVGIHQDDGTVLEGFVDLVYRDDDGRLVIVDYKTDSIPAAAIGGRTAYYAPQLAAYEQAIAEATSAIVSAKPLFLHPDGAAIEG